MDGVIARETAMKLVIGNMNYSSWSMRPWVLMRHFGIAFDEVLLRFDFAPGSVFYRELGPRRSRNGGRTAARCARTAASVASRRHAGGAAHHTPPANEIT
jgi:hypothetical protein